MVFAGLFMSSNKVTTGGTPPPPPPPYLVNLNGLPVVGYNDAIHPKPEGIAAKPDGQYFYSYEYDSGKFFASPFISGQTLWDFGNTAPFSYTMDLTASGGVTAGLPNSRRTDMVYANGAVYIIQDSNLIYKLEDTSGTGSFSTFTLTTPVSNPISTRYTFSGSLLCDGICFNGTGTELFISDGGGATGTIHQFSLSAAYDLSSVNNGTATKTTYPYTHFTNVSSGNSIRAIRFSDYGRDFFMLNESTNRVLHYRLGTPYNLNTITLSSSVSIGFNNLRGLELQPNIGSGTRIYVTRQRTTNSGAVFVVTLP